jgi:hypothetical protein
MIDTQQDRVGAARARGGALRPADAGRVAS